MIGRAKQERRIPISAWAILVALLPSAVCWADEEPSTSSTLASATASLNSPRSTQSGIPAPRNWTQSRTPISPQQNPSVASIPSPAGVRENSTLGTISPSVSDAAPVGLMLPSEWARSKAGLGDITTGRSPFALSGLAGPIESPAGPSQTDSRHPLETSSESWATTATPAARQSSDLTQPASGDQTRTFQSLGLDSRVDILGPDARDDDQVSLTGCATCGGYHSLDSGPGFHQSMGCENGLCIPGRKPCYPPANSCNTVLGTFCQNLYQCLVCPDPCYQPQWVPAANASFFADYARPRTVTRLRYDNLENMTFPDRNQFWIQGVTAMRPNGHRIVNPMARLQQFYVYQEAAGQYGSFFIEYPYRQINQSWAPTQAGFGNLDFGIKSLMFDCELLQVTFQFRTYMPTGNGALNLGDGIVSLDPSILTSLKLGPETYFQGQFGNWIPLGGSSHLAGGMFYSLMSLNQVVAHPTPDSPLIATLEMDVWSFENGGFTAAINPNKNSVYVQKGGGVSYFNIGPGLRQSIGNKVDLGGAITWATGTQHWAQPWFRFEVRFLF